MTRVGLIDVGDADLREHLIKVIDSKGLKLVCNGERLKVTRALTDNGKDRNTALFQAKDLILKQDTLRSRMSRSPGRLAA